MEVSSTGSRTDAKRKIDFGTDPNTDSDKAVTKSKKNASKGKRRCLTYILTCK